jgi:hypothetical protein
MLRWYLPGVLTVVLLASALFAKQGTVTTRAGETFTGDVTSDDKNVFVNGPGGQLSFKKENIVRIDYVDTIDDQYDRRHAKLKDNDVKGRIDLANWANDNRRADLAIKALQEARKIDPSDKDAARALDGAEQQLALDQSAANGKTPATGPASPQQTTPATPGGAPAASAAPTPAPNSKPTEPRRLLNEDEINLIRIREMAIDDAKIKVRFSNNVIKRYLSVNDKDKDPATFSKLLPAEQALDILGAGDPAMSKDVKILNDPAPLLEFKKKILPLVATGCGSVACHGGNKAGAFALFPGESTNAVYTNFYILQTYAVTINKKRYLLMDREIPDQSLVLQFGLPLAEAAPPHPVVPNWRPRFRTSTDPAYKQITDWLSNSLKVIQPDYGLNIDMKLAPLPPATKPAAVATKPVK